MSKFRLCLAATLVALGAAAHAADTNADAAAKTRRLRLTPPGRGRREARTPAGRLLREPARRASAGRRGTYP